MRQKITGAILPLYKYDWFKGKIVPAVLLPHEAKCTQPFVISKI